MLPDSFNRWREVWVIDTEYRRPDGEKVDQTHCLVAIEMRSGQVVRLWRDELTTCPFSMGNDTLFVMYSADAEMGFFEACYWEFPHDIIDLMAEYRWLMSGLPRPSQTSDNGKRIKRDSMYDATFTFGIHDINQDRKDAMRDIAIRGVPFTDQERRDLLDYCEDDVRLTAKLFLAMAPHLEIDYAILRGDYLQQLTKIGLRGIPLDAGAVSKLRDNWDTILAHVVRRGEQMGVYDNGSLRQANLAEYARRHKIHWPRTPSGRLKTDLGTFRDLSRPYSEVVGPLYEIESTRKHLRRFGIKMGHDGRNRAYLNPFGSKTGRNQPYSSEFVFGPARWVRCLIKPPPGWGVSYLDWNAQEIGIAAYLSGDPAMIEAVQGDPYLWLAQRCGYVPVGATKESHPSERDIFKVVYLAANYRMGQETLANNIQESSVEAVRILRIMRREFPRFWQWSESALDHAIAQRKLRNVLGWQMNYRASTKSTTVYTFPVQSNGAAMLHAAILMLEREGIEVIAPVHDAVMIQAPAACIHEVAARAREIMADASELILLGKGRLRTSATTVCYPDRFVDGRGIEFFNEIIGLVE
jgi:hypothetical protein